MDSDSAHLILAAATAMAAVGLLVAARRDIGALRAHQRRSRERMPGGAERWRSLSKESRRAFLVAARAGQPVQPRELAEMLVSEFELAGEPPDWSRRQRVVLAGYAVVALGVGLASAIPSIIILGGVTLPFSIVHWLWVWRTHRNIRRSIAATRKLHHLYPE